MTIYHLTGLGETIRILQSGEFKPKSTHPLDGDNGINLFDHRPGYWKQHIKHSEAVIFFEWLGPKVVTGLSASLPLQPAVLHDQYNWRMFIRGPIDKGMLRVTRVSVAHWAIDAYLHDTWPTYLPPMLEACFRRKRKRQLLCRLRSFYRSRPAYIQIAS